MFLLKIVTFPVYIFVKLFYVILRSIFNVFIGSVFFEHTITRKEKFVVRMFFTLLFVFSILLYFIFVASSFIQRLNLLKLYIEYFSIVVLSYFLKYWPVVVLDIVILIFEELTDNRRKDLFRLPAEKRAKYRERAIMKDKIFVGSSMDYRKKPLYLTNEMRSLHTLAIGTTGSGKTEGFLKPWALQDILRGYGAIIVDPKGDVKLFHEIYSYHKAFNKHNQNFYYLNLGDPEHSNTYNPIFRGTATELKDRIMNMVSWGSERYYRIQSEMYLFNILLAIESLNKKITVEDLYLLFTQPQALSKLIDRVSDPVLVIELQNILENYSAFRKECNSLVSNLGLLSKGPLSSLVNTYNPDIDLLDAYQSNDVLFFSLPTNLLTDTARAFGRMLLMDLQSTSGYIHLYDIPRRFYPVFIDEFGEFAVDDFISWLNKARSSGYSIHIAFQEAADLEKIDRTFMKQIIGNTSVKVVFCVHDNETAETMSKILGTVTVKKETERIDKTYITQYEGMVGSVREVEEFRIHPNVIKNGLRQGQCLIWGKIPEFYYSLLNADYIETDFDIADFEVKHRKEKRVKDEDCLLVKNWLSESVDVSILIKDMDNSYSVEEVFKNRKEKKERKDNISKYDMTDEHIDNFELNNIHAKIDEDKNGIDDNDQYY